jgi:hypothetical protein
MWKRREERRWKESSRNSWMLTKFEISKFPTFVCFISTWLTDLIGEPDPARHLEYWKSLLRSENLQFKRALSLQQLAPASLALML